MTKTQTYKSPVSGQPLITAVSTGCLTPKLTIKFCNLVNPFYYPNSPLIPRYSVTCLADPDKHKDFLKTIQTIENNEKVNSIIKNESEKLNDEYVQTGNVLLKFQTKDKIPIYIVENEKPELIELEDEFHKGETVVVMFDIMRYTKKNTTDKEHGLNFKPTRIYYYPKNNEKK